jgi:hypothetical protein
MIPRVPSAGTPVSRKAFWLEDNRPQEGENRYPICTTIFHRKSGSPGTGKKLNRPAGPLDK